MMDRQDMLEGTQLVLSYIWRKSNTFLVVCRAETQYVSLRYLSSAVMSRLLAFMIKAAVVTPCKKLMHVKAATASLS